MKPGKHWLTLLALAASLSAMAATMEKPVGPPANPFLAESSKPIAHSNHNFTALAGPRGPSRRLNADEIQWKPLGPINSWLPIYSGPYPSGKRVIWAGGMDRIVKLDADTMETLSTYAIGGTYYSEEEVAHAIEKMEQLNDDDYATENVLRFRGYYRKAVGTIYRLLTRDNELYVPHVADDGTFALRVYGDDKTDPTSPIVLKREWKIPADISPSQIVALSMTYDGYLIMATTDGTMIALSRDLQVLDVLKLPRLDPNIETKDFWTAFLRNSVSVDDQGGLYVVTRDYMHRVQWTGSKMSLDESTGAWTLRYPNGTEQRGSGTTPGLVGWGPNEDHLALITDGEDRNSAIAYWRDKIPDDWKGLPGMDRRVAGTMLVRFGISPEEKIQIENSPVVYGYDVFLNNHYPQTATTIGKTKSERSLRDSFSMQIPGRGALGGAMMHWDPKTRALTQSWQTSMNLMSTVCTISGPTKLLYCWGNRDREYTLEGLDWKTGNSAFTYTLGKSKRFNPLGGWIDIAPNGAVDCGCAGGQGFVRIQSKEGGARKK